MFTDDIYYIKNILYIKNARAKDILYPRGTYVRFFREKSLNNLTIVVMKWYNIYRN